VLLLMSTIGDWSRWSVLSRVSPFKRVLLLWQIGYGMLRFTALVHRETADEMARGHLDYVGRLLSAALRRSWCSKWRC
jgi:hypothetical protein